MIEHLRTAAAARHEACYQRARDAIELMTSDGSSVNFRAVARRAAVSTDFLYSTPELRSLIESRRPTTNGPTRRPRPTQAPQPNLTTGAVRALSQQVKELRARHHVELTQLHKALAAAHGENLELRRQLDQLRLGRPTPIGERDK
jgi:hypothetical protein